VCGFPKKFVFQGVHMLFQGDFTEDWKPDEVRESKFVFIGRNLDKEELTASFLDCTANLALRYSIGDKVYARRRRGSDLSAYDKGVIIALWDEGNPYRIRLDDGMECHCPEDVDMLIRSQ
jgi:hypothetical protein